MSSALYQEDLAYIQAAGFGGLARNAAPEILRRLSPRAKRVVDVGCGAGVLTRALVDAGHSVTAIDASAQLLEVARKTAPQATFVCGSIYDYELPACEAVVALGEPLTYHAEDAAANGLLRRFFERVARVLPAGGLLIFDVIETGEPSLAGRFWTSGEDWAVLAATTEDPARRILRREIETFRRVGELYRRGREVHSVRLFDTGELCSMLAGCGFTVETARAYGDHALAPRRRAFFATRTG